MTTAPGPLGEEAAKLVEALSDWARTTLGEAPVATGAAECRLCPFCQLLAVMRRAQPETFAHLADASASFVAALRTVLDSHAHGGSGTGSGGGAGGVQRIDLDDDAPHPDR